MIRSAPRYARLSGIAGPGSNRTPRPKMGFTGLGSVAAPSQSPFPMTPSPNHSGHWYGYGHGYKGMGRLGQTGQQLTMSSLSIAGSTVASASQTGAAWATAAIPFVGPIIAGVTVALSFLFARKGPRQKVATTEIVNAVEPELVKNLEGYLSGPRTVSSQAQALANFDAGWSYVMDSCNIPEMGDPGQRCTDDRQSGACVWRDAQGECWNWFKGYRDPIANDPQVKPDPVQVGGSGSGIQLIGSGLDSQVVIGTGSGAISLDSKLLLGGAAVVLGLVFAGGGSGGRRGGFRQ